MGIYLRSSHGSRPTKQSPGGRRICPDKNPFWKNSSWHPNYGYDWTLPFVQGTSKAVTIGNVQAVQIAIAQGSAIFFDEIAQSPYFTYTAEGTTHEVWFEDVRSLSAKFGLVKEYQLRGMSYWQIMQFFRANWLLLNHNFTIL